MWLCEYCGHENNEEAVICEVCGTQKGDFWHKQRLHGQEAKYTPKTHVILERN